MKKILNHPLFSGSILMVGGNMFANVINYIYQIYFSGRLLGPVGNGQLGSLFAILYIVTIIPVSTSASIVKFISSAKNHSEALLVYKEIYKLVFRITIMLTVLLFLISPLISNFIHIPLLSILVIPFILFFSLITLINQATMQGLLKFWGSVGPNIVSSTAKLAFGLIFVLLGGFVFGAMVGILIGVILAFIYSRFLFNNFIRDIKPKGKFNFDKFLKYSFPVLIHSFAFTSIFTVDVILVKHFFPDEIAGQYVALSTLGKIIYFAASPVAAVMFPMVASRHSKGEKFFHLLLTSLFVTLLISLSVVSVYFVIPKLVIGLSYGQKYINIAPDLPWMGLFICFYSISYFMMNFFLSIDKIKLVLLPLFFSVLQIILLWIFHTSILQVIQISLTLMVALFTVLSAFLVYNRIKYEKIKI